MNQVVEFKPQQVVQGRMSVADVTAHAIAVQEIMRSIMKEGTHFGKIPGTDKPTLLKSGAELLCMTFRVADEYKVDDLSSADCIRYRVTCTGRHQMTGVALGSGMGECSTNEEKYRWRKAVCAEEYEITPSDQRRIKFGRKSGGHYKIEQVRTEWADLANTALKMACKRAKIAMVLNVTAASDMFAQDLEDLDDVLREHIVAQEAETDPALRDEWVAKANAAKDSDSLAEVWKKGVAEINKAKDKCAYDAFKAAVGVRGAALKADQKGERE